jgi:hypothetical protein
VADLRVLPAAQVPGGAVTSATFNGQPSLAVSERTFLVGNDQSGSMTELALSAGEHRLRIFVDAEASRDVSRVIFALSEPDRSGRTDAADV